MLELDQIFPGVAPGAGRMEGAVGLPLEPFRVLVDERRAPAGVVDDDVEEDAAPQALGGRGQFPELVDGGGALVEFDQGRIDGGEVELGVGRAEATIARRGGRSRTHRQQVEDPAVQPLHDMGQLAHQIAEGARGRDHRIALVIEHADDLLAQGIDLLPSGRHADLRGPEHAGERAIDGVRGAVFAGMDRDPAVAASRPILGSGLVGEIGFGLEVADLGQRQVELPRSRMWPGPHRDVAPGSTGEGASAAEGGDRLIAQSLGASQIRSQEGRGRGPGDGAGEGELDAVSQVAHQVLAGSGSHRRVRHDHEGSARPGRRLRCVHAHRVDRS